MSDRNLDPPETPPVDMDLASVRRELHLSADAVTWLEQIDRPVASLGPELPDDAVAAHQLERLGVDEVDRSETLAARPDPDTHPALWWVLDRAHHALLAIMGKAVPIEGHSGWPVRFSPETGLVGRYLPVWMYLATIPDVRRYHAARGIPDEVSWSSLSTGLVAVMEKHRSVTGFGGIGLFGFGTSALLHFRGAQYRLGQLEFTRGAISLSDGPCGYALSVHIPPVRPLSPTLCDEAFAQASEFFSRHFPEEPVTFFTCESWLLDPQLADYLPETSNIIQFQRRFHLLPVHSEAEPPQADGDVAEYVFGRSHRDLDDYPQETTLQRAYVAHLRSGGHWHERTGWMPSSYVTNR
ncbi:acyltransferase domain-containing protein [Actinopolymorpha sp. B9G3]|uniref:acyltransferase domain-containing protein n=1 Tax=Actinopolymorpha sp. B9G3 TaxID=3158970 RepID=UPI0032D9A501